MGPAPSTCLDEHITGLKGIRAYAEIPTTYQALFHARSPELTRLSQEDDKRQV